MMKMGRTLRQRLILFVMAVNILSSILGIIIWSFSFQREQPSPAVWPGQMMPLALTMLIAIPLSALVSKPTARPFTDIIEAMKAVSKGDYHVRVEEKGEGEVVQLLHSFNQMAAELESTELMRSDFINNFSHEFKTPIVSIRGFAKRLCQENLTEDRRREYSAYIVRESERLADLSANILLLSRYENQQIIRDRKPYSLDEQLRRCVLSLEQQWSAKHLEPDIDLPVLRYTGNEEMMEHVWLNLIGNAVKFSYPGGIVRVRGEQFPHHIEVTVSDEGIGMDRQTMEHIFDRFFQGETAHSAAGNGLGLSLARRIVELCGGEIRVESEAGAGASFHVLLPTGE